MKLFEYICLCISILHVLSIIAEIFKAKILGKKIERLCEKCGSFVYDSIDHQCLDVASCLSSEDLKIVLGFVNYLRKEDV